MLAGAAAGALAGILLAPEKGSVTRENIAKKGRDTVDNLKGQVSNIVDKVSENYLSGNQESGMGTERSADRSGSSGSHLNSPGSPGRSFS